MTRRWLAMVAVVTGLLGAGVAAAAPAGAEGDPSSLAPAGDQLNCVLGGLAGIGSAGLVIANPPSGLFNVIATAGVSLVGVQQVADACGSWWTVELGDRVHLYAVPPPGCVPQGSHHCAGGGGGGGGW